MAIGLGTEITAKTFYNRLKPDQSIKTEINDFKACLTGAARPDNTKTSVFKTKIVNYLLGS